MEALDYLHNCNIYYGDMKPENLLIFRDYRVKIGDFGVTMKLNDNSSWDSLHTIKGLTNGYSHPDIVQKFLNSEQISKREMWENDTYSLY